MKLLFKKNYLTQIENSAKGENYLFRNFYVKKEGEIKDSLEDGKNSCAVMVSHILYSFNSLLDSMEKKHWIKFIHLTVASTEKDMIENGWDEIGDLRLGAILIWEKKDGRNGEPHNHIGFYIGNDEAISNDSKGTGFPYKHHVTYNETRKIEKIFWHPDLDND
ncbi:MAG TPA: hypothetical protein VJC06_03055 [Candidatus Paceibacterota bacterium]